MTIPAPAAPLALWCRLLAWLGLAVVMGMPTAPAHAAASDPVADRLIVVGTGGFTWAQVSQEATPALWELLAAGSSTTNSVRSVNPNTCPVDGWLSLSAGQRAAAPSADGAALRPTSAPCPAIPQPTDNGAITVPEWATYVAAAHSCASMPNRGCWERNSTRREFPGRPLGRVPRSPRPTRRGESRHTPSWTGRARVSFEMRKAMGDARVVFVDVGSVRDPADLATGEARPEADVATQLAEISRRVGLVESARASDETLNPRGFVGHAGVGSRLRPIVVRGPDYGPGELYSPSTRQPGLAQSQDLTVTILRLVGQGSRQGWAAPCSPRNPGSSDAEAVAQRQVHLNDVDDASCEIHPLVPIFFYGLILAHIAHLSVHLAGVGARARLSGSGCGWSRSCAWSASSRPACRRRPSWPT